MEQDQDYGVTSQTLLASYDRDTRLLKTSARSLFEDSTECFVTLPKSGSMRNGRVYARPMLARHTDESACSFLLPTPNSYLGQNGGGQHPDKRKAGGHAVSLKDVAVALLPTPTTAPSTGNGHARNLGTEVKSMTLLPTPTVGDSKSAANLTANRKNKKNTTNLGMTLTDWAKLRGETTNSRLDDGPASPDTLHRQQTIEGDYPWPLSSG